MDKFRDELKKQLSYCYFMENFRTAVYVSSKDKAEYVIKILKNLIDNNVKYEISRCLFSQYEYLIDFSNGSILKVMVPSESNRGCNVNGCLIDKDISVDIKRIIIYPRLYPRSLSEEKYNFESWDNVKERVVEVKIREDNNE